MVARTFCVPARSSQHTELVLDTGTANDICPKGTVGLRVRRNDLCRLETANGVVQPKFANKVEIEALGESTDFVELDHTVAALTVGRRCAAHGYHFEWKPFTDAPTF